MKIISIEPTPSPNAMKLNMDESIPNKEMRTYDHNNKAWAPDYMKKLLDIEGVKSVFHTADFISIDRHPKGDWQYILSKAREVFGEGVEATATQQSHDGYGEVDVFVQMFRHIPMQIRVRTALEEVRESLPERFVQASMDAGMGSPNLIKERKLVNWGVRYGNMQDIAQEVLQELDAAYDQERLGTLVEKALEAGEGEEVEIVFNELTAQEVMEKLHDDDWRVRYAALDRLRPSDEDVDVLAKALDDSNASIRRLAVIYLGEIGEENIENERSNESIMPLLFKALKDSSASVRRTAGDTLSDLGDPAGIGPMIELLKDRNKIVRWRAARYLYETGDETAIEALREAKDDPEFEVSLQVNIALERIEGGKEAEGTIWQQMTRARS